MPNVLKRGIYWLKWLQYTIKPKWVRILAIICTVARGHAGAARSFTSHRLYLVRAVRGRGAGGAGAATGDCTRNAVRAWPTATLPTRCHSFGACTAERCMRTGPHNPARTASTACVVPGRNVWDPSTENSLDTNYDRSFVGQLFYGILQRDRRMTKALFSQKSVYSFALQQAWLQTVSSKLYGPLGKGILLRE